MISRFKQLVPLRLRSIRGRLCCLIPLPEQPGPAQGLTRQLVLVASPTAPHFRRLLVYRRLDGPASSPDETPRAA